MTDKQPQNDLGSSSQLLPKLGSSSQLLPKASRIYISRPQHQELLRSVSAQLGSSNLKDGLEHILNCWLVGNVPAGVNVPQQVQQPRSIAPSEPGDEFDGLMSFGEDD